MYFRIGRANSKGSRQKSIIKDDFEAKWNET